jgi:hypothetical protein
MAFALIISSQPRVIACAIFVRALFLSSVLDLLKVKDAFFAKVQSSLISL